MIGSRRRTRSTVSQTIESTPRRRKVKEEVEVEAVKDEPESQVKYCTVVLSLMKAEEEVSLKRQDPSSEEDDNSQDEGLSEYEKMRMKNLQDNAKFFAQLGISEAKAELSSVSAKKKSIPTARGLKPARVKKPPPPCRSSMRIRNIDPEPQPVTEKQPSFNLYDPEEDVHVTTSTPRVPEGPLAMAEALKNLDDDDENLGEKFRSMVENLKGCKKPTKTLPDTESYVSSLKKLKITENRVAKLTPKRIFSVAIHPSEDRVITCAGGSWGELGVWDVESRDSNDGVYMYTPHSRPVSCVAFHPQQPSRLLSCSYDGTVRCGDFTQGIFDEVYATPYEDDIRCSSFSFLSNDSIVVSQSDGFVGVVDMRTEKTSADSLYPVHQKALECVDVHPVDKNLFITACKDGTVAFWDIRHMKTTKNAALDILPHKKLVHSAYFSPITGNQILTTSFDDKISIYDSSKPVTDIPLRVAVRHDNHTYCLSNFKAAWHPAREDVFVVGSTARPRKIEVFAVPNCTLAHTFQDQDWLGSVCSLNAFHPTRNIVVGGNSSGRMHVFM